MLFIIMCMATVLVVGWLVLLSRISHEDWVAAAYGKMIDSISAIEKLRAEKKENSKKPLTGDGTLSQKIKILKVKQINKKITKLEKCITTLKQGNLKHVNALAMPGYVLIREFSAIGKGEIHKKIMTNTYELYGKKNASWKAKQVLAGLISYPMIATATTLLIGAIVMGVGNDTAGTAILGIGSMLVLVLAYAMYDQLSDNVKKRRNEISKQFPNVVSKLALLVTSGMVMDRAWKETAYSQESILSTEMRKTAEELDNLVSPEMAYSGFINRCNTKETAKLASAIMQNLSKGNAEVGRLLKDMAREAWLERRHLAKRDAEKANSKLMIPTMLLLLAILVMLMVPVAMNFSGL